MFGGQLTPATVIASLKSLFGADHRPERKDLHRSQARAQRGGEAYHAGDEFDGDHEDTNFDGWYADDYLHYRLVRGQR